MADTLVIAMLAALAIIGLVVIGLFVRSSRARKRRWLEIAGRYGLRSKDSGTDHAWMEGDHHGTRLEIERERQTTISGSATTFTRVTAYPPFPPSTHAAGRIKQLVSDPRAQAAVRAFSATQNHASVSDDAVTCTVWDPFIDPDFIEEAIQAVLLLCLELQAAAQRVAAQTPPPVPAHR